MPYTLLATIALYALLAKHSDKFHSAVCAGLLVGGSLALRIAEYAIIYGVDDTYLNFTQTDQIVTVVLQYILAAFIFYKIRDSGDNDLPAYFGWVASGWLIIFMAAPFVVGKMF